MSSKSVMYLALGFITFPIIAILIRGEGAKVAEVHAQAASTNMMTNSVMLSDYNRQDIGAMMKQMHGPDWKQDCQKMMDSLGEDDTNSQTSNSI